ncbi:MAG: hypothetical protein QOK37_736 [Thermoanaerobaculia bacterium]|jgi:hypothetical protein|nr:hypothetical protein [Thermoanaerobaculia bacterium]
MDREPGIGSRESESGTAAIFAIVSRDELHVAGTLVESRMTHGVAWQSGDSIDAIDTRDEILMRQCNAALADARDAVSAIHNARVRIRARAARENGAESASTTITIGVEGISIVTTPAGAQRDYDLLKRISGWTPSTPARNLPIVWQNGSAAVLLHEAIGHASEQGAAAIDWPSWLSVDAPITLRRETFRDVPIPRMTHLIARQSEAPFTLPQERIDVHLIAGGAYDPVTDVVTISVAVSTAGAFVIKRTRAEIAASLAGAMGDPIRYPGVICSREGQEIYVPSCAPVMITEPLT